MGGWRGGGVGGIPGWVGGGSLGVGFWGWGPTQGGTETRRLQGTERAYEGAYTFGACKRVGGQARSVKDSWTFYVYLDVFGYIFDAS